MYSPSHLVDQQSQPHQDLHTSPVWKHNNNNTWFAPKRLWNHNFSYLVFSLLVFGIVLKQQLVLSTVSFPVCPSCYPPNCFLFWFCCFLFNAQQIQQVEQIITSATHSASCAISQQYKQLQRSSHFYLSVWNNYIHIHKYWRKYTLNLQ